MEAGLGVTRELACSKDIPDWRARGGGSRRSSVTPVGAWTGSEPQGHGLAGHRIRAAEEGLWRALQGCGP